MRKIHPPKGGIRRVFSRVLEAGDFIKIGSIIVQIMGLAVSDRIQGIDDAVAIGVQQPDHFTIILGDPDGPIPIIIAHGDDLTHGETQEVIDIDHQGLFKPDTPGPIHS
jgi:hypothetical protein